MAETLTGTCLCEGVEYEVQDPAGTRATATAHAASGGPARAWRVWSSPRRTSGSPRARTWSRPTRASWRRATSAATAGPASTTTSATVYFVAAGLMRDLDLEPSFHQQVAYKAQWHQIGDDAPQFAEMPPA